MTIVDAINSMTDSCVLTRKKEWQQGIYYIPTDTESCVSIYRNGKLVAGRWNPHKAELVATDWQVEELPMPDQAVF